MTATMPAPVTGDVHVEVEVRGSVRRLRWTDHGVRGDRDALDRLLRSADEPDDAISFLRAVRLAFGDGFTTHVAEPGADDAGLLAAT
ncbi:hypothetical protein [Dermatobacter hominis]|uniref:hypothetical protein n=1 Tax=Dermatobacter hominis TaxID=2884263 RepID=UPI001D10F0C8|nr:hypothetical protein [Dermatobacter hominis]UDY37460.1 hypothetical protein LH044_07930 [Dermatobacter hominis]